MPIIPSVKTEKRDSITAPNAGIHDYGGYSYGRDLWHEGKSWMPACAGMTVEGPNCCEP
jgi:hypothetical protein